MLALLFLTILATPAPAAVEVALGWGGQLRPGRWNVASVTASRPETGAAVLEWYVPQPGRAALVLRQPVTLSPTPRTFRALLPIAGDLEALHLTVRDATTGETIGFWPPEPIESGAYRDRLAVERRPLVGTSGEPESLGEFGAYLDPALVPNDPAGFDALDRLALARPELEPDQEAAVAAWVRAGGELVLTPPTPFDPDSPLARLLGDAGEGRVLAPDDAPPPTPRLRVIDAATAQVPPIPWRPPLAWIAVAFVIGPLDWLALRLAGLRAGRLRRGRRWLTVPGWVAFAGLLAWHLAANDAPPPASDAAWWSLAGDRTDGPVRDVPATLAPGGVLP